MEELAASGERRVAALAGHAMPLAMRIGFGPEASVST
jgi:hypothetical protein